MDWVKKYQLFLFDFDGLLVNTEEIHFLAYQQMCEKYGFKLNWTFAQYCQAAHYSAEGLKIQVYEALPDLYRKEPNWDVLYSFKRQRVIELLEQGCVSLMPGVEKLLQRLDENSIKRCVVTHSPQSLVDVLRKQHPILNTIPHWITRHDYMLPKPHPEGYLMAIKKLAGVNDQIIGFEDTPRGIKALMQTSAIPILISKTFYNDVPEDIKRYQSFDDL